MDWPQVRQALKDQFDKARRPLKRHLWRVLEARREPRESAGAFAWRLANAVKDLKRRLVEGQYANYKGRWEAHEELAMDVLKREVPEKVKAQLRAGKFTSLDAAVIAVEGREAILEEERLLDDPPEWHRLDRRGPRSPPQREVRRPPHSAR